MDDYLYELLKCIAEVQAQNKADVYNSRTGAFGISQITPSAWKELVAYYPEKYKDKKYPEALLDPVVASESGSDYLGIIKKYIIFYKLPITIETLMAVYNMGITEVVKSGIENIPDDIKYYSRQIRLRMQPQAETLDVAAQQKG